MFDPNHEELNDMRDQLREEGHYLHELNASLSKTDPGRIYMKCATCETLFEEEEAIKALTGTCPGPRHKPEFMEIYHMGAMFPTVVRIS